MLRLKNIFKDYKAGDTTVNALKDINIEFPGMNSYPFSVPPDVAKPPYLTSSAAWTAIPAEIYPLMEDRPRILMIVTGIPTAIIP